MHSANEETITHVNGLNGRNTPERLSFGQSLFEHMGRFHFFKKHSAPAPISSQATTDAQNDSRPPIVLTKKKQSVAFAKDLPHWNELPSSCQAWKTEHWPKTSAIKLVAVADVNRLGNRDKEANPEELFFGKEASDLFSKMIRALGINSDEFYISSVCWEEEKEVSINDFLIQEIVALSPQLVLSFGAKAAGGLFGETLRLSRVHGKKLHLLNREELPSFWPLFHPEYLLLNPSMKRTTWEDMKKAMAELH